MKRIRVIPWSTDNGHTSALEHGEKFALFTVTFFFNYPARLQLGRNFSNIIIKVYLISENLGKSISIKKY